MIADRFTVFPAIDLREGRVVRLHQGRDAERTDYGDDPAQVARDFVAQGARALHVVDLDAAFGDGDNREWIARIVAAVGVPVQVGGGVRSDGAFDALMSLGVTRAIVGSAAVEDPAWVASLTARHGARVVVGLDALDGDVKLRGWVEGSARPVLDVALQMQACGVREVIFTNISQDGTLLGPDLRASIQLAAQSGLGVVVSGGVGSLDDVRACARAANDAQITGVIVGKALYEHRFSVADAVAAAADPEATC